MGIARPKQRPTDTGRCFVNEGAIEYRGGI